MIFGILSDTHGDRAGAIPHIIAEFKKRNVGQVIHCGDIEAQHVDPELFGNFNVVCALNQGQLGKSAFETPPPGWVFTAPGQRIIDIHHIRCYVGHRRSFEILTNPEVDFRKTLESLRREYDGLRWMFAGHTHHQIFFQTQLVNFINPGAVEDAIGEGYEFAIVDTEINQIVFCRILRTKPVEAPLSVGIISDTLNISKMDLLFWEKLRIEFEERNVTHIIHCGNIVINDIGRRELDEFQVYFWLRPDQINILQIPGNWHLIPKEKPIVEIQGHQFFIHPNLARILLGESEIEMHRECLKILEIFPEVSFILYGGANGAFLEEGERARIMNPGDAVSSRNFAVVCLPRIEITFGHVPVDPLPPIK